MLFKLWHVKFYIYKPQHRGQLYAANNKIPSTKFLPKTSTFSNF